LQKSYITEYYLGRSEHTLIAIFTCISEKQGPKPGTPKYNYLRSERDKLIDDFREMLKDDYSVFLYPTHPVCAPYHNEPVLRAFNFSFTSLVNVLGMPSCNIPLGLGQDENLPIGIQCVANYNNDRLCLAVASELERAFGGWVAPSRIDSN
jgi:fatty acid amide hydrolase 2